MGDARRFSGLSGYLLRVALLCCSSDSYLSLRLPSLRSPSTPNLTSLHHPRTRSLSSTPLSSQHPLTPRVGTPFGLIQPGHHIANPPKETGVVPGGRRWLAPLPSGGPSSPALLRGWPLTSNTAASFVREGLNADVPQCSARTPPVRRGRPAARVHMQSPRFVQSLRRWRIMSLWGCQRGLAL